MAKDPELPALDEVPPDRLSQAFEEARQYSAAPQPITRGAAAKFIAATGAPKETLPLLDQLADDQVPGVRLAAVAALAGCPWRGRRDLLFRKLADSDLGVAAVAADGLAYAGDRRAEEKLVALAAEKQFRFDALQSLFELDDPRFAEMARQIFRSIFAPPFERGLAALYLAAQGDAGARAHVLARARKKRAEERPMLIVKLAAALPGDGRSLVEEVAQDSTDYLRESALLALTRVDRSWWPGAQEALAQHVDTDPHVAGEILRGLFQIDWERAALVAPAHCERETELGRVARRVRLAAALRHAHPAEVFVPCG